MLHKKTMLLTWFVLCVIITKFSSAGPIDHWTISDIFVPDKLVHFRVDIYTPTTPGSYPVLVFLTGLAGLIPPVFYDTLMKSIATQDTILIGISKIENIKPERVAVRIGDFLEWIVKPDDGLVHAFQDHSQVKGVTPDLERLGFLTHSAGAHPVGQYLNGTCGIAKLLIMMNPVDGLDPYGIVQDFITHPPNPLPFQIPTLIISNGLDNVPAGKHGPPCAPKNVSNDRWYYSLYGPTFLVNLTDYGHADNLDDPVHAASTLMCAPCKGTVCDFPQYKHDEATLVTSFVYAVFNRDLSRFNVIENPKSYLSVRVSNKYDLHGYNYTTGGPGGFCTHN